MSDIATKLITVADNTPAVSEAVNGAKATVRGAAIRVDDVLDTEHLLQVQTAAGTQVTVVGKNLLSALSKHQQPSQNNAQPIYMKAGEDYTFSHNGDYTAWRLMFYGTTPDGQPFPFDTTPGIGAQDPDKYIKGTYTAVAGRLQHKGNLTGKSTTFTCNSDCIIYAMQFWVTGTENTPFTQYQLEYGAAMTEYEPYKASQTATADSTGKVEGLRSVSPTMTMMVDHGAEVQCTYFPQSAADTYAKYQELKSEEMALQEKMQEYLLEESTNE